MLMKRVFKIYFLCCFFATSSRGQNDTSIISIIKHNYRLQAEPEDSVFKFSGFPKDFLKINLSGSGSQNMNLDFVADYFREFSSDQFPVINEDFFLSENPFVRATYLAGSNKEQIFNVKHSQFFSGRIGYSLNYHKSRTEGFYRHQLSVGDQLRAGVFFLSKNRNYFSGLTYQYHRINREENGGLVSDSLFENGVFVNNLLHEINLDEAVNNIKVNLISLKQLLKFGSSKKIFVEHNFNYSDNNRTYSDNPSEFFYSSINYDSVNTLDEFSFMNITNKIIAGFYLPQDRSISFSVTSGIGDYSDVAFDTSSNNLSVGADMHVKLLKIITNKFSLNYFFNGYNSGDFYFTNKSRIEINGDSSNIIELDLRYKNQKPLINYLAYHSNNFIWMNQFSGQSSFSSSLNYKNEKYKLKIGGEYILRNNYIYFNSFSRPEQYDGVLSNFKINAIKSFPVSRWSFDFNLVYQWVSNKDIIRIPDFVTRNSINYSSTMWSMKYKAGLNLFYYSSFYSNAYSPALQIFYLQNEKKTGNYPYFGVFFEGRIKSVGFYFAINHINEGLTDRTYYSTVNYPMNDRTFQFGISWDFID